MKKKSSKFEEEKKMNGWLYGWKDIAVYIGCSKETAEMYCKKYSMPVIKSPTGKPMCNPRKIDHWLENTEFKAKKP